MPVPLRLDPFCMVKYKMAPGYPVIMCWHVCAGAAQVNLTRTQPFVQNLGVFPLVLTGSPTDPNLEIGTLPPSFDPNILLPSPSNFTAQFSYFPTSNFTRPFDLFVFIRIQVRGYPGASIFSAQFLLSGLHCIGSMLARIAEVFF